MRPIYRYALVVTVLLLLGGFMMTQFGWADYGWSFFIFFPMAIGFVLGAQSVRPFNRIFWYIVLGIVVFCLLLIISGLEGAICVLMALPILLGCIGLGYFLGWLISAKEDTWKDKNQLKFSLLPLVLLFGAGPIERALTPEPELEAITTTIELPYAAETVYDAVISMDTLDADRPLLMKLGLPAPYKCVLEKEEIGGRRTCFFPNGQIASQMTALDKPHGFSMAVVDYTLIGLHWFHFEGASYTFEPAGANTRITRTTTYRSVLRPRFYWQRLERWGIQQEHEFVLASLKKNLARRENIHPQ